MCFPLELQILKIDSQKHLFLYSLSRKPTETILLLFRLQALFELSSQILRFSTLLLILSSYGFSWEILSFSAYMELECRENGIFTCATLCFNFRIFYHFPFPTEIRNMDNRIEYTDLYNFIYSRQSNIYHEIVSQPPVCESPIRCHYAIHTNSEQIYIRKTKRREEDKIKSVSGKCLLSRSYYFYMTKSLFPVHRKLNNGLIQNPLTDQYIARGTRWAA